MPSNLWRVHFNEMQRRGVWGRPAAAQMTKQVVPSTVTQPEREAEIAEGIRLARLAVEYGRDDAVALTRSGHALLHLAGEIDAAIALLDRALVLNPNLATTWMFGGYARLWDGDLDGALSRTVQHMHVCGA